MEHYTSALGKATVKRQDFESKKDTIEIVYKQAEKSLRNAKADANKAKGLNLPDAEFLQQEADKALDFFKNILEMRREISSDLEKSIMEEIWEQEDLDELVSTPIDTSHYDSFVQPEGNSLVGFRHEGDMIMMDVLTNDNDTRVTMSTHDFNKAIAKLASVAVISYKP